MRKDKPGQFSVYVVPVNLLSLSVKIFALPEWKTYKINRLHICDSIRVDEEQDSYTIGFLTDPVAVVTSSAGRTSWELQGI
jgi:hypothetical protein